MVANRDDDGRYTPAVEEDTILSAVETHAPAATSEVADELGLTRQAADYRLRQLRDREAVSSKKIGASLVWFPAEDRSDDGAVDRDAVDAAEDHVTDTARRNRDPTRPLRDRVAALDLEGSGSTLEARRAALVDVLEHLREEGSATAAGLKALVDDDDDRLYADANSFWRNMSRQRVFADLDVVEKPGRGGKRYYYVTPEE